MDDRYCETVDTTLPFYSQLVTVTPAAPGRTIINAFRTMQPKVWHATLESLRKKGDLDFEEDEHLHYVSQTVRMVQDGWGSQAWLEMTNSEYPSDYDMVLFTRDGSRFFSDEEHYSGVRLVSCLAVRRLSPAKTAELGHTFRHVAEAFRQSLTGILNDRGSRYAVMLGS